MTLRPASIVPNLQQLTLRLQPLGFHNLSGTEQVLTDAAGNDGVYHQECGYQDMFGRICKDVRNYLDVDLFNTQQRDPLNTRLVVNANMVPAGQYIGVTMYFTDVSNQRDSYAILANGAECEVRVEPISYQDWTMRVVENSAVGYEIVVDFSENVVSPTEDCADGPLTLTGKIVGLTRTH